MTQRGRTSRILVVGPDWEGSNVTSMSNGLAGVGAEVHRFDTGFGLPRPALPEERLVRRVSARRLWRALEARLAPTIQRLQPDLTLIFKCEWLSAEGLQAARAAGCGLLVNFWPDIADYEDFWLMGQCRHFIIANRTFSW